MSIAPDAAGSPGAPRCDSCGEVAVDAQARFCENCGGPLAAPLPEIGVPDVGVGVDAAAAGSAAGLDAAGAGQPGGAGNVADGAVAIGNAITIARAAAPSGACPACGATDGFDADGFCLSCGVRPVRPRDRLECDLGVLAAVSDKGPRKVRNEDSFAVALLADGGGFALSVCDGVSNIPRSDEASQGACDAAVAVLGSAPSSAGADPLDQLMVAAAARASDAVTGLARSAVGGEPPSCTFLAARWHVDEGLTVGWLGDCRAYLVSAAGVRRLTTDHSWGSEAVAAGRLTQREADADERSHAITRWLGADAGVEPIPQIVRHQPSAGAVSLLVCVSDGAWNYLASPEEVATFFTDGDLLAGARRLTEHAIVGGGHDNITVVAGLLDLSAVAPSTVAPSAASAPDPPTNPLSIPTEPT